MQGTQTLTIVWYHIEECGITWRSRGRLIRSKYNTLILIPLANNLINIRPQNAKELFNLRHASLRNAVERIFGVLKRRFKILKTAPEYNFETQIDLILALTGLFNFIRIEEQEEEDDQEDNTTEEEDIQPNIQVAQVLGRRGKMDILRDQIAEDMWKDYQEYINRARN